MRNDDRAAGISRRAGTHLVGAKDEAVVCVPRKALPDVARADLTAPNDVGTVDEPTDIAHMKCHDRAS